jgi:hypothetical protein
MYLFYCQGFHSLAIFILSDGIIGMTDIKRIPDIQADAIFTHVADHAFQMLIEAILASPSG